MTPSYDKNRYTNRKIENQWTTQKRLKRLRLHNDCGPTSDSQLSNNSRPTGVVNPGLKSTNLPTHRKSSVINRTLHDRNIVYNTKRPSQRWLHVKS